MRFWNCLLAGVVAVAGVCGTARFSRAGDASAPANGTGYFMPDTAPSDTMSITNLNILVQGGTANYYAGQNDTTLVSVGPTSVTFSGRPAYYGATYSVYGIWLGSGGGLGLGPNSWTSNFFPEGQCGVSIAASPSLIACGDSGTVTVSISSQNCQHGEHTVGLGTENPPIPLLPSTVTYPARQSLPLRAGQSSPEAFTAGTSPGYVFATAAGDNLVPSPKAKVAIKVVGVAKLQYKSGSTFVDISDSLYVLKGTTVTFKATPNPAGAWPLNKPVWGGTAGATGHEETKDVTFTENGTKTVTVTCGNMVSVSVTVYELTGVHIAEAWFNGRATVYYGVAEVANLSFTTDPAGVTAAQIGGLAWSVATGGGAITKDNGDGTGTYKAPNTASAVTLSLTVQGGPSKNRSAAMDFSVIAPSGTTLTRTHPTTVWHRQNAASAGIELVYSLRPTQVSFEYVQFGEGRSDVFDAAGICVTIPGHSENTFGAILRPADNATGSKVSVTDKAWIFYAAWAGGGSFVWKIPTQYIAGGVRYSFGLKQNQTATILANGDTTQAKDNQSGTAPMMTNGVPTPDSDY